jgi:hypothetical protein
MKSIKLIVATAILILVSTYLTSCKLMTPKAEVTETTLTPAESIEQAVKVIQDVTMRLSADRADSRVTVKIVLDNPNGKSITSVESWLSYDPDALKGERINVVDSPFEFTAPYDNTFDEVNGLVMLGRANSKPITTKTINVAEVVFELLEDGTTMIDTYDYQSDMSGHVSANILLDGVPYNVLLKPESPALIIQN